MGIGAGTPHGGLPVARNGNSCRYLKEMIDPVKLAAVLAPGKEIYEHDELHELVAYGDVPIYTTLKRDPTKAMLSRKLFEAADLDTKIKLVREESMVRETSDSTHLPG